MRLKFQILSIVQNNRGKQQIMDKREFLRKTNFQQNCFCFIGVSLKQITVDWYLKCSKIFILVFYTLDTFEKII